MRLYRNFAAGSIEIRVQNPGFDLADHLKQVSKWPYPDVMTCLGIMAFGVMLVSRQHDNIG